MSSQNKVEVGVKLTCNSQLGWTLPFAWAGVWTLITIPWVQSDLRREKAAWAENRGQGGIPWTDDITAPTARTRFESVQEHLPSLLPWVREKQSAPSTPSADGAEPDGVGKKSDDAPDGTASGVPDGGPDGVGAADDEEKVAT